MVSPFAAGEGGFKRRQTGMEGGSGAVQPKQPLCCRERARRLDCVRNPDRRAADPKDAARDADLGHADPRDADPGDAAWDADSRDAVRDADLRDDDLRDAVQDADPRDAAGDADPREADPRDAVRDAGCRRPALLPSRCRCRFVTQGVFSSSCTPTVGTGRTTQADTVVPGRGTPVPVTPVPISPGSRALPSTPGGTRGMNQQRQRQESGKGMMESSDWGLSGEKM